MDLGKRVFLFGPNASGKSNLLDVFRFLHDIVSVGGGFEEAVRKRGGVSILRSLATRHSPAIVVRVRVSTEESEPEWEYELRFTQEKRRLVIKKERVTYGEEVKLDRPNADDEKDPLRLTQTYLEQVNANRDFREVADFFGRVRYLHIVPQLIREPDRSVGRTDDPFGGDFLQQIADTQERTQKARLRKIREALTVAVPQLKELELTRDGNGTPHLRGRHEHWRPNAGWQNEDHFSDGTLRLFGLLWSVQEGTGPLLLEEPELSLHSEVIRYIPAMFSRIQRGAKGRQILVSTHSEDLLEDKGVGLDEVLVLEPGKEGTVVSPADSFKDMRALLDGGVPLSEVVSNKTKPVNARQLALFGK